MIEIYYKNNICYYCCQVRFLTQLKFFLFFIFIKLFVSNTFYCNVLVKKNMYNEIKI